MSISRQKTFVSTPAEEIEKRESRRSILVVDDSRVQRRILVASLRRWGYEVIEAACGTEALDILKARPVDIVLSDWMMPGLNGPDLCRALRGLDRSNYGYFILLTSKTGKEDVARGLDVGADDFLSKPVSPSELRARIAAGERILAMAEQLIEKNNLLTAAIGELQDAHDAIDRDLLEARRLQESLTPLRQQDFGAARLSFVMRPAWHVGGDLVGCFRVSEHKIAVYSIDVSGHGVASALLSARLASYLSGASPAQNVALETDELGTFAMKRPCLVAATLNTLLLRELDTDLYFTMCLAEIDLRDGHVRLVQAGHPNPAVQRASGEVEFISGGGMPIGLLADATYETQEMRLAPGDRLLICSDGMTECEDAAGQLLDEGLADMMRDRAEQTGYSFLETLIGDIEAYAGRAEFSDDVSGVLMEYVDSGRQEARAHAA